MAVMNRSMFQRPMPVVRRMAGTPRTGEQNYEDQGYDAYEYRADKAMENTRVINLPDGNKRILSQTDIDMLMSIEQIRQWMRKIINLVFLEIYLMT